MFKLYITAIVLFLMAPLAEAQTGNTCSNPKVAQLCSRSSFKVYTDTFTYYHISPGVNWTVGAKKINTYGAVNYYQVNVPTGSYQTVSLSAIMSGYFPYCSGSCNEKIYFFWYENPPCSSNPIAVDSAYLSGSSSFHDSLYVSYPVSKAQNQYYLAVAIEGGYYRYFLQLGYSNSQPAGTPVCSVQLPPYKGQVLLDNSECYTSGNPYHLPLSDLNDNTQYPNMLFPPSLNQNLTYLPINDNNGNGFILTIKTQDANNTQAFKSFDNFPYTYSYSANPYDIALTVFFKNKTGASGLKGFRIQVPGATGNFGFPFPAGRGFYDTTGTWAWNYDYSTHTYTWLFGSKTGRGDDTDINGYSCMVYTFDAEFYFIGDTIRAWYLPDNYGNDSIQCIYPSRTDCNFDSTGGGWIPIIGSGAGNTLTGTICGSDTSCYAGVEFQASYNNDDNYYCDQFLSAGNYGCQFTNDNPYTSYDSSGCLTEVDPLWIEESPDFEFQSPNGYGNINGGICNNGPYLLELNGNGCYNYSNPPVILAFNDNGYLRPVDSLGNINYNIDLYSLSTPIDLSSLPVYPCSNTFVFTIPLSVPGTYSTFFTYSSTNSPYLPDGYYPVQGCYAAANLTLVNDSGPMITITPFADTTICSGAQINISASGANTYVWMPDTSAYNYIYGYAILYPSANTTYTIIGSDQYGCTGSVNYNVEVNICPPVADFSGFYSCDSLCGYIYNQSQNAPSELLWSFPGATPPLYSGQTPPRLCYNKPGVYFVKLVVSNSAGEDSMTQYVQAGTCIPQASFAVNDTVICQSGCVTYYNQSSTYNKSFFRSWSFPGGSPPFLNIYADSVTVCYNTPGVYSAQLIYNSPYPTSDTFSLSVHVVGCGAKAGFSGADAVCNNNCITYTNTSTGNPSSWEWTFQDGTPSSFAGQHPPQICYGTPGIYKTQLIVTNNYGSDTITKTITVTSPPQPAISQHGDSLDCTRASAYQWYFQSELITGATNNFYLPSAYGEYEVNITDSFGCTGIDSISYINTGTSALTPGDIIISPNPTAGRFEVAGWRLEVSGIEVFNLLGELILDTRRKTPARTTVQSGGQDTRPMTIDLTSQSPGIYFVKIQTTNGMVVRKVVKE